jgi:hypothetical protein
MELAFLSVRIRSNEGECYSEKENHEKTEERNKKKKKSSDKISLKNII